MVLRKVFSSAALIFSSVLLLMFSASPMVAAASASAGDGNGLKISPVRSELTVKPGESQTLDVYVTNLTSEDAELKAVIDDFTAGTDETGTPYILLNGEKAPSHSLKDFVTPISNFELKAKDTQDVKVTVSMPKGIAGGGYFGAVRFVPVSVNGHKNVNLTASIGSLLLVTVPGNIVEQLQIESFDARKMNTKTNTLASSSVLFTNNKNIYGVVRFKNTGNIQTAPFGKIMLKKGGTVLGNYEINKEEPRGNVLPDSIRRFSVPLHGLGSFGKYTLEGNFGYGDKGQLLTAKTNFYIVPIWLLIIFGILIVIILLCIFMLPKMIKKYNRGVINKASRNARR